MKPIRYVSLLLLGAFGVAACDRHPADPAAAGSAAPSLAAAAQPDVPVLAGDGGVVYVPGQVIARFRPGASAERVAHGAGAGVGRALRLSRTFVLNVPVGRERQIAGALSRNPNIEFAELNEAYEVLPCETGACEVPNDPSFLLRWDLHNPGSILNAAGAVLQATGRADADIDWLEAHDALGSGFAGTAVIAIIDTGVRKTHQDLAGRVIAERNFAPGYPAEFADDRNSHGTSVAGVAAAHGSNGLGVPGVAYGRNIRIINAKSCELYQWPDGVWRLTCIGSATADAIVWAVDQGANVLNLSQGGGWDAPAGLAIHQAALRYARARNVLPICAVGNHSSPGIAFPARFPECVAVGGTTWDDARASYSNYASELDLTAPSGGPNPARTGYSYILTPGSPGAPDSDTQYTWRSGTSLAAPQVSGLAALLFASGMTDADAVLARITETVDDLGPAGHDAEFGAGRVNVCRALDPARLTVTMPGSFNRASDGVLTVVIHAVPGFDPARLDEAVLRLGDGTAPGAAAALRGDEYRAALVDADADGDLDLVVKFSRPDLATNVASGATELVLRGNVGCRRVEGRQDVNVIR